ncbi:MAG: hypothetical protein L0H51_04380, partial [Psychrobacter sp.]|nr:hypothetical protein [Psychrobacter sp.]
AIKLININHVIDVITLVLLIIHTYHVIAPFLLSIRRHLFKNNISDNRFVSIFYYHHAYEILPPFNIAARLTL